MAFPTNTRMNALAAKVETTAGVDVLPTFSSNAIRLLQPFEQDRGFLSGNPVQDISTGGIGQPQPVPPGGQFRSYRCRIAPNGYGGAYTSVVTVPEIHPILLAMGYSVSYASGALQYSLVDDPSSTLTVYADAGGKTEAVLGCVTSSASLTLTAGTFPVLDVVLTGALGSRADHALDPATYNTTPLPIFQNTGSFVVGGYSPVVRSVTIDWGISAVPRANGNAAQGHSGHKLVRRVPTMRVRAEDVAASTWDPQVEWETATPRAVSIVVGSASTKRLKINIASATVVNVQPADDGGLAALEVTYQIAQTPAGQELDIIFD